MYFLENNPKIKLIPEDIKFTTNGVVTDFNDNFFTVKLDSSCFTCGDFVEIMISNLSCILTFDSVIKAVNENSISLLLPQKVRTIQRREYERIEVSLPIKIKEINGSELNSICQDLSGGGLKLISSKPFNKGSMLEAKLKIFDKKSIITIMEVLRVNCENDTPLAYSVSGRFVKISNTDRTAIIQLCFKRQLEKNYKNSI